MHISIRDNNPLLSWTVPSGGYTLQKSPDPTASLWTPVTQPVFLNLTNLQDEIIITEEAASAFYRLVPRGNWFMELLANHRSQRPPRFRPVCILPHWRGAAAAERYAM
jgi:hypothetical protein